MKHKIIITSINGRIVSIASSGDTEIYLMESNINGNHVSKLTPDIEFENGEGHKLYREEVAEFLKKHGV
jgi:hypothetical protein